MESVRNKRDWVNGLVGGVAGGAMLGMKSGNMGVAVGSMAALGLTSVLVDASGGRLTGRGFSDEVTPKRRVYPYEDHRQKVL